MNNDELAKLVAAVERLRSQMRMLVLFWMYSAIMVVLTVFMFLLGERSGQIVGALCMLSVVVYGLWLFGETGDQDRRTRRDDDKTPS